MRLEIAWGSKTWTGPLWPSNKAPQWAKTFASRMEASGVPIQRINEVLREMRRMNVESKLYTLPDGQEFEVRFE